MQANYSLEATWDTSRFAYDRANLLIWRARVGEIPRASARGRLQAFSISIGKKHKMFYHAPDDYICPFCLLVEGIENEDNAIKQSDIVYQNEIITSFIGLRSWPNNPGHVLTIPNDHYENIYDLPKTVSMEIHKIARSIALAMKDIYACDGILLIQRNEAAGGQKTWHYHLHIIPRYENDNWELTDRKSFSVEERAVYANKLKIALENQLS